METYDVLIVGAGPAGLMAAVALASQNVKVGILEKNASRPERGRADGLEPRTLEILNSYGLLDSWWRHASNTVELSVWVSFPSSLVFGNLCCRRPKSISRTRELNIRFRSLVSSNNCNESSEDATRHWRRQNFMRPQWTRLLSSEPWKAISYRITMLLFNMPRDLLTSVWTIIIGKRDTQFI